jgi:uroporphyrinogen-III synthase
MSSALFTTRLETNLADEIEKRQKDVGAAQELLPRVRALVLGEKSDPKIKALSKNQRYTEAARDATAGLALDPLAEELNFLQGEISDFLQGSLESRRFFDRYLALRGIRVHDYRTYQGKSLSREERRAIDVVQAAGGPQPGMPGAQAQPQPPK